jgi:peptidoglycan/xylan/chitin deacetylase (PgdA/CDA1 family)
MQPIKTLAAALAAGVFLLAPMPGPAAAQESCTPSVGRDHALGTARTVEVDTSRGPLYGFQYKDQNFLEDGEVVLTFDDGPLRAYTVPVLEALAAHCTKATFFVVGRMAVADPEMVKEYARRGHTIGTHTWSHTNLRAAGPARARAEIELGFSAVQKALGKPIAPFFRFPFLADPPGMIAHLKERQIGIFSIDVDSKDFRTRDPGTVHRRVMGDLARPRKGIILFHDIQPSTARALPGLLADLKAKGYRVVHMVPKATAATVAEFDVQAEQELERKRTAAAARPLAKRALTWPVADGVPKEPASAKEPADAGPRTPKRTPRARKEADTWPPPKGWLW